MDGSHALSHAEDLSYCGICGAWSAASKAALVRGAIRAPCQGAPGPGSAGHRALLNLRAGRHPTTAQPRGGA